MIDTQVYLFYLRGGRMSDWVITTVISLGIGVITYFLKRTMNQVDKQENRIQKLENTTVTRTELEKNMDKLEQDIKQIRADYLTKDDFIREIGNLSRKLDRVLEMMINRQGNGG